MEKKIYNQTEFFIVFLAVLIGVYAQFSFFTNKYIISDDVRQHIYWMRQFHNQALFQNDLLTIYAKNYQPWGFVFLYYLLSFIVDPVIVSKVLPTILFSVSSLYMYKLVKHIANGYTGFIAASLFMVTPVFINRMIGGLPRSFAYLLVIMFLYYLIKKEYVKTSFVLIMQCLFYPMILLICALTYLFTFIKFRSKSCCPPIYKRMYFEAAYLKRSLFAGVFLISILILGSKYVLNYNPDIGSLVSRKQMLNNPEYYREGRYPILPIPPLASAITRNLDRSSFLHSKLVKYYPENVFTLSELFSGSGFFLFAFLFLAFELYKRKVSFPPEPLFMIAASILLYKISDVFLLKLFLPERYLEYTIHIACLMIISVTLSRLIVLLRNNIVKKAVPAAIFVFVFLNYSIHNKNLYYVNASKHKRLYKYLQTLPPDSLIAAPPSLADNIPTFAGRKVFFNYELSHPFYNEYWKTIKKRTSDFFDAYYADDFKLVYEFCEKNGVDYLVVAENHFKAKYFERDELYFEPFNSYIKNIGKQRKNFVLADLPDKDKLFSRKHTYVISKTVLKNKIKEQSVYKSL